MPCHADDAACSDRATQQEQRRKDAMVVRHIRSAPATPPAARRRLAIDVAVATIDAEQPPMVTATRADIRFGTRRAPFDGERRKKLPCRRALRDTTQRSRCQTPPAFTIARRYALPV